MLNLGNVHWTRAVFIFFWGRAWGGSKGLVWDGKEMARRDQVYHASFGRTRGKVQARCRQGGSKGPLSLKNKTRPTHRPCTGPVLAQCHALASLPLPYSLNNCSWPQIILNMPKITYGGLRRSRESKYGKGEVPPPQGWTLLFPVYPLE